MSDSESDEIAFSGYAPGRFIAAVRRRACDEGKHQDREWQADYAVSCFQASAKVIIRWYRTLDEDVQTNWDRLSEALVSRFGDAGSQQESLGDVKESLEEREETPRRDDDQYTPETEKTESELFDYASAPISPASTGYITPLPTPPITRTGRIRLIDIIETDPKSKPTWVSKRRNGNGAHTACDSLTDAIIVSYEADPESDDAWLGVTWPGRHSDDWTTNPTLVAAFATVTHDKTGTQWVSSSNRDEGATKHEVWKVDTETDSTEIEYLEDNGTTHKLVAVVACYGGIYLSQDPDEFIRATGCGKRMRKVRLVLEHI